MTRLEAIKMFRRCGSLTFSFTGLEKIGKRDHTFTVCLMKGRCFCPRCKRLRRYGGGKMSVRFEDSGSYSNSYSHNITARQVLAFIKRNFPRGKSSLLEATADTLRSNDLYSLLSQDLTLRATP